MFHTTSNHHQIHNTTKARFAKKPTVTEFFIYIRSAMLQHSLQYMMIGCELWLSCHNM